MIFFFFCKLAVVIIPLMLWASYAQTLGHVWLYVSLVLSGFISLKTFLPYACAFVLGLFLWWGVYGSYEYNEIVSCFIVLLRYLLGRNIL